MTLPSRAVWAIGDLHLSRGVPNKGMELFGELWKNHDEKLAKAWDTLVSPEDIVVIPGDISWAMRLSEALPDLCWIDSRPGIKVLVRGNHDYWWDSIGKVRKALPKTIYAIQNDVFCLDNIAIAGARLWDTSEYTFQDIASYTPQPGDSKPVHNEEIYVRELGRLETSLQQLPTTATVRIAATHFPPIGNDLSPSSASALFERHHVDIAVFGHLHAIKPGIQSLFGTSRGVSYVLASCDWLNFSPIRLC